MEDTGVPKARVAFILVDGLGDLAIPSLGFKSPVEAAKTPNLDALASGGVSGLMDPVEPELGCGSDTAHLSLLGYNPRIYYRGRGAFESLDAGLAMVPGDIAFKSNFATIDEESGVVTSRRADRHFEEPGPILCVALNGLKLLSFPQYKVYAICNGAPMWGGCECAWPEWQHLRIRPIEGRFECVSRVVVGTTQDLETTEEAYSVRSSPSPIAQPLTPVSRTSQNLACPRILASSHSFRFVARKFQRPRVVVQTRSPNPQNEAYQ